jgi:hypothetical protein
MVLLLARTVYLAIRRVLMVTEDWIWITIRTRASVR